MMTYENTQPDRQTAAELARAYIGHLEILGVVFVKVVNGSSKVTE